MGVENDLIQTTRLISLMYYNDVLLKACMLTEREYKKMYSAIIAKHNNTPNNHSRFRYRSN